MSISREDIDRIKAISTKEENIDLSLAWNGQNKAMQAYNATPGKKTSEDLDASRLFLVDVFSRLQKKYFPEESEETKDPESDRFVNRKQALNWLTAQGYKISQGKFYQDCKAGFPAIHKDGSISKYQVMQYGQQLDLETRSGLLFAGDQSKEHSARKEKAEAEIAEMKAERMRREEDRYWLHAEDAWSQVAAVIGTLRDAIRHHIYIGQQEIIHTAGGDHERSQEAFEAIDNLISQAFNEVAGSSIDVTFEKIHE